MTAKYTEGREEVIKIVAQMIDTYHPDLKDAKFDFVEVSQFSSGQHPCKLVAPSPSAKARGFDLVFMYDGQAFASINEMTKVLVDHALEFWSGIERKGRQGKPARMVYHHKKALQIHIGVVQRHGAAMAQWKDLGKTMQQLTLDLGFDDKPTGVVRRRKGEQESVPLTAVG
jgi:hypothetical protein